MTTNTPAQISARRALRAAPSERVVRGAIGHQLGDGDHEDDDHEGGEGKGDEQVATASRPGEDGVFGVGIAHPRSAPREPCAPGPRSACLLYTSDAADDLLCV